MKLLKVLLIVLLAQPLMAEEKTAKPQVDELTSAYQREILFLSTYKRELQEKINSVQGNLGKKVKEAQVNLNQMESKWLKLQTNNEVLLQKLTDIERDYENKQENRDLLDTTLKQAELSNEKKPVEKQEVALIDQISTVFASATASLNDSTKIISDSGTFYLKNGEQDQGNIISLGTVARFAEKNGKVAALYPSGGGTFRVWQWLGSDAQSLSQGSIPTQLGFFLFDNPDKEYAAKKEKTIMDTMQAGGLIGWIIVIMGLFAAIISAMRFMLLRRAESSNTKVLEQVVASVQNNKIDEAQKILLTNNNSTSRVLNRTLSFLKTEPQKVEDAIMESIIKESQLIDRFGVVILVIASVAPLMGLLGTVTGMISTFDIITMYGTGNPKLLSGGISEALVTTMFGLIVAIPALLIGQFLSAKTENIKADMEKWALATCNAYNNRKGN